VSRPSLTARPAAEKANESFAARYSPGGERPARPNRVIVVESTMPPATPDEPSMPSVPMLAAALFGQNDILSAIDKAN
jgi:hypothetical protein